MKKERSVLFYCVARHTPTELLLSTCASVNSFLAATLAGDVVNPQPVRYLSSVCSKAVKSNERRILCDRCELWSHAKCCQIDAIQYDRLGLNVDEDSFAHHVSLRLSSLC